MVEPAENLGSGALEEVGDPVEPQLEELQLMEEMVELGEAEPPLLRALSYWSRDSVLAIKGPSTAIPVVTELGRYLAGNQNSLGYFRQLFDTHFICSPCIAFTIW